MPKRRCWNPLERKKYMPKPCEHQQVLCPSHCETVAGKMPKRRCWNPLKRERNRARTAARFVLESRSSSPPPFDHNFLQQLPRRAPPHSDEGSADIHIMIKLYIYIICIPSLYPYATFIYTIYIYIIYICGAFRLFERYGQGTWYHWQPRKLRFMIPSSGTKTCSNHTVVTWTVHTWIQSNTWQI